jgi:LAO/AO transport system kinase
MKALIQKMRDGDRRALARLLSLVENQDDQAFDLLEEVYKTSVTNQSVSIGITGPAGAGKSTLIDQLIRHIRQAQKKVSILAVDPSSPFTGGAILGDRVRMQRHCNDEGVFIRSIGSRGKSGGVSFATRALLQILEAYGSDYSVVETVGAGQSEVDIMNLVDTTVVVLTPESGDSIQALKAGMLEIADIFVINKKDRDGADRIAHDIEMMLSLTPSTNPWKPPILLTCAQSGEGIEELVQAIDQHKSHCIEHAKTESERVRRRKAYLAEMIQTKLTHRILDKIEANSDWTQALAQKEEPNLYAMVRQAMAEFS